MNAATKLFRTIDIDNSGFIDRQKLKRYIMDQLKSANSASTYNEKQFEKGFKRLDTDSDGHLLLSDFYKISFQSETEFYFDFMNSSN